MPKVPKTAVSESVRETLTRLHVQIEAAQKLLQKMPGARTQSAVVSLSDVYPDGQEYGEFASLEFWDEGLRVVFYGFDPNTNDHGVTSVKRLEDMPTVKRIEIAKHIPELIRLAKAAEGEVKKLADDVAASIEQAIAESMEIGHD